MKTYSLTLILLITLSSVSAQNITETGKSESGVMIFQNNDVVPLSVNDFETGSTVKEAGTIEATVVRASDIKIYLNLLRNVGNIDVLFPEINKIVKV